MADQSKPYNVAAALRDHHRPEEIRDAIRRSGRKADTTGVSPYVARIVLGEMEHVPSRTQGPFGLSQPPIASEAGMQRPAPYQPPMAPHDYAAPSVQSDAIAVAPRSEPTPQNAYGGASMIGAGLGGVASLLAGPAAPLAALPLAGWGAAAGKGVDYAMNAAEGTDFAPKSVGEVVHGVSGAGLTGMATELVGQPLGAGTAAATKWLGNKVVRGGVGVGEKGAEAMTTLGITATKGGAAKLRTRLNSMNDAVDQLVANADARAAAPSRPGYAGLAHGAPATNGGTGVAPMELLQPVLDLYWKQQRSGLVSDTSRQRFGEIVMNMYRKLKSKPSLTYKEVLEVKRVHDDMVRYSAIAAAEKRGAEHVLTSEQEIAAKAVADKARAILGRIPDRAQVRGIKTPMTLSEIHGLQSGAIEAERAINATFTRPTSQKVLPYAMAGGALYGSHGDPSKALMAYLASAAATDPAINSTVGMLLQNPALLGAVGGLPQNAARAGLGALQSGGRNK